MFKILLILVFHSTTNAMSSGHFKIGIFKTEDNLQTPLDSFVNVKYGSNFSLRCKVDGAKFEDRFHNTMMWGRQKEKLKDFFLKQFITQKNLLVLTNSSDTNDVHLNFTSVTMKDQGNYFCVASKYKLFINISVIIRPEFEWKFEHPKDLVSKRKRFLDSHETYNRQELQYINWQIMHELDRAREQRERQQAEDESYRRRREEERQSNDVTYKIVIKIVIVVILFGGTLCFLCLCRNTDASDRSANVIREALNRIRGTTQPHTRQLPAIYVRSPISGRGSIEFLNRGLCQEAHLLSRTSYIPNSHGTVNTTVDLPPSYEDIKAGSQPSVPPDCSHASTAGI